MPGTVLGVVVTAVRKTHIVVELAFRERIPSLGGQCQTQGGSLSVFDEHMGGGPTWSHRQSWKDPEVPVLFTSHFWACVPSGAALGLGCEDGLDHTQPWRAHRWVGDGAKAGAGVVQARVAVPSTGVEGECRPPFWR